MTKKRKDAEVTTTTGQPIAVEIDSHDSKLRANLEEIKNYDGVVGYILRKTASASVDLKEPSKITEYALLSSTVFDSTTEFSRLFGLGNPKDTIISGKSLKMLFLEVEDDKISIFMESNADMEKVLRKIRRV